MLHALRPCPALRRQRRRAPAPSPTPPPATTSAAAAVPPTGLAALRADAAAVLPLVTSDLAKAFLAAPAKLTPVTPRTLFRHKTTRAWYTAAQAAALPEADRAALDQRQADEQFYYTTKYGSPIAYARAIDLLGRAGFSPIPAGDITPPTPLAGSRILDFGYGGIGQLQLLAQLGAAAVGVDVDPLLPILYSEKSDQGPVEGATGSVTLVNGQWPAGENVAALAGGPFDLIISKNTLKKGYIHPQREVDKRMLVDLGVTDEEFLAAVFAHLKPRGWFMIYNICPAPAPADKPYIPWADGQCPFPKDMLEHAGFEVLSFDTVDDGPVREMARALGWNAQGMDVDHDLFAWYTIVRKK